jgi:hypothetical protein
VIAYCWASGVLQFGRTLPDGAIEIARGPARPLRKWMDPLARRAYDGKTLLVPGVPEARGGRARLSALCDFVKWIRSLDMPAGIRVVGSKA